MEVCESFIGFVEPAERIGNVVKEGGVFAFLAQHGRQKFTQHQGDSTLDGMVGDGAPDDGGMDVAQAKKGNGGLTVPLERQHVQRSEQSSGGGTSR